MNLDNMTAKELLKSGTMKRLFEYVKQLEEGKIDLNLIRQLGKTNNPSRLL